MRNTLLFAGATVLAACACGASRGIAAVVTRAGAGIEGAATYYVMIGIGAALFAAGAAHRRAAWLPAGLGTASLFAAIALAPQMALRSPDGVTLGNAAGYLFYFTAGAFFVLAALRVYAPARPAPATVALSGAVLATGCTCCLTAGAAHTAGVAMGLDPAAFAVSRLFFLAIGFTLVAVGSLWAGRRSAIGFSLAGGMVSYFGEIVIARVLPIWMVGGIDVDFLVRYPTWMTAAGLIVFGASRVLVAEPVADTAPQRIARIATPVSA